MRKLPEAAVSGSITPFDVMSSQVMVNVMPKCRANAAVAILVLLLAGCGSDSGFDANDFRRRIGSVQIVNMMPDSPLVQINHASLVTNVPFPSASLPQPRSVSMYNWNIIYLDTGGDRVEVHEAMNQQIAENTLSTFLLMGNVARPNIRVLTATEVATANIPEGMFEVWFAANLASSKTNHNMVDIYLTAMSAVLANETPMVTLNTGNSSDTSRLTAGMLRLRITPASDNSVLLFDSGSITIAARTRELFALVDDFGPEAADNLDVIRIQQQPATNSHRTAIASSSQPTDVRIGNYTGQASLNITLGDNTWSAVAQDSLSAFQATPSNANSVSVTIGGTNAGEHAVEVVAGSFQTVFIFDDPDDTSMTRAILLPDYLRQIDDRALFRFINGSSQAVDLYALRVDAEQSVSNTQPLFNDAPFGGSVPVESQPVGFEFLVTSSTDSSNALARHTATLEEMKSYTLILDTGNELHLVSEPP